MKAVAILKQNRALLVKNNADLDFFTIDVIIQELEAQLSNTEQLTCVGCKYLIPETYDDYEQCKFDDTCTRWEANLKTDHFQPKYTQ